MKKRSMHQDIIIGFVCLVISLIFIALNSKVPSDAALMPRLLASILIVLSLFIIFGGIRKSKNGRDNDTVKIYFNKDIIKIPILTWFLIGIYVMLFYLVGYFLATAISLAMLMIFLKRKSKRNIVLIIFCYVILMYAAFVMKMHVPVDDFGRLSNVFL